VGSPAGMAVVTVVDADVGGCRGGSPPRSWVARRAAPTTAPVPAVAWPGWSRTQARRPSRGLTSPKGKEAGESAAALSQRFTQAGADLAVEQMPSGVQGPLAPAVPGR
jgi:hypothetical protein